MGTTLTGTTPQDTYDSLIKVTDNGPLSGTAKYLSDGLGNDSVLALSTTAVGVSATSLPTSFVLGSATTGLSFTSASSSLNSGKIAVIKQVEIGSGNGDLTFETYAGGSAGGERMRITSAGDVAIGSTSTSGYKLFVNGSIYFAGATNYIDGTTVFRPTGAEVGRFTANGLTFNGDTAAANALDDYEEGTWTMGISFGGGATGIAYANNTGTYTKIGRQVTVNGLITLSSKGSSTGNARITGLPFTINNGVPNYGAPCLWFQDITFADQFQALGIVGTTNIELAELTNAGAFSFLNDNDFGSNVQIAVTYSYFV
jgi:hypothetical protein